MRRLLAWGLMVLALLVPPPAAAQTPLPIVAILQNDAAANGNGQVMPVLGYQVVTVQISNTSGSPTFTVNFEGATNELGPTGVPLTFSAIECASVAASTTLATTATSPGSWRCTVTGLTHFRARVSGYSGSGSVRVIGTSLASSISGGRGTGTVTGSGTINTLAKFSASTAIGNSLATDDGVTFTYGGTGGVSAQKYVSTGAVANSTFTGTVNYCADAGSSDTYACSIDPAPSAYTTGACYIFKANTANTGAATINLNSLGAKTIKKVAGGVTTDLADNDIRSGQIVEVCYDSTNMQMQSTLGNAGGLSTLVLNAQNALTAVNCNGATPATLFTYTMPSNTLTTSRALRLIFSVTYSGITANITVSFKLGSTLYSLGASAATPPFVYVVNVLPSATNVQDVIGYRQDGSLGITSQVAAIMTEDLTASQTVAAQLTCVNTDGNVTPRAWRVLLDQ